MSERYIGGPNLALGEILRHMFYDGEGRRAQAVRRRVLDGTADRWGNERWNALVRKVSR